MKPIIIDMREISFSKELYDKQPHVLITTFTYFLLIFIMTAFIWMYISEVDIVVRAPGIIRPHGVTATIINPTNGWVSETLFCDGQEISCGDILYIINESNFVNNDNQTNKFIIYAPIDGKVSVMTELIKNNYVMSGAHILSIIPTRGNVLDAHIFIDNSDIGRITEGAVVNYNIAALPYQKFEKINGYITKIASDISSNQYAHNYYLVESELEDRLYHDDKGNNVTLRAGMVFEARIVVGKQKILFYLLDILNLKN